MSMRSESRKEWATRSGTATEAEIKLGALQRIADATEVMARDRVAMEAEIERLRRATTYWRERCDRAERSRSALRGVISRMKRAAEGAA